MTDIWSDWFEGLVIQNDPGNMTILSGTFIDQAALLGMLTKIHALNLTLISVNRRCVSNKDKPEVSKNKSNS